jgi:hypothetical protein
LYQSTLFQGAILYKIKCVKRIALLTTLTKNPGSG